jgi:hypothetical protein
MEDRALSQATDLISEAASRGLVLHTASSVFVCAWCQTEEPSPASPAPAAAQNFGICEACLEDRLRVLEKRTRRR